MDCPMSKWHFHAEMPLSMLKKFRLTNAEAFGRQPAAWKN
jgi:hypothetical protein